LVAVKKATPGQQARKAFRESKATPGQRAQQARPEEQDHKARKVKPEQLQQLRDRKVSKV
jgi:hypothetical protein